jgi:hypothetical protein
MPTLAVTILDLYLALRIHFYVFNYFQKMKNTGAHINSECNESGLCIAYAYNVHGLFSGVERVIVSIYATETRRSPRLTHTNPSVTCTSLTTN